MKRFALIGAAGYIAPRHLKAIKDVGGVLVAALDKSDSVGVLDSFFPEAAFFTEFERFDRYLELLKCDGGGVDYVSVCSPNYLHDAHVRFALRLGADAICEKPLSVNPWNVRALAGIEDVTGRRINTILQLRLSPVVRAIKDYVGAPGSKHKVSLVYTAPRGRWYDYSWKGDESKSGGIIFNIGIHLFDLLCWLFGKPGHVQTTVLTARDAAGRIDFDSLGSKAEVEWFLSLSSTESVRRMVIDGKSFDLSDRFIDLHTESYRRILAGDGFRPYDVLPAIELAARVKGSRCHIMPIQQV